MDNLYNLVKLNREIEFLNQELNINLKNSWSFFLSDFKKSKKKMFNLPYLLML